MFVRILHICLCGPVTDNWSYQDNYLPKYHKRIGFDVSVIASKWIYDDNGAINKDLRDVYDNEYGIKTIRIENKGNSNIFSKFKRYKSLYQSIENEKPDIIFLHGTQFLDICEIKKYIKKYSNVVLYVDNHADFSNSATNWISKNILHKIVWKKCAKLIEPYTTKFYGVLPARVDFLADVYGLPKEKIELLVMGADDDKVKEAYELNARKDIREKYNISEEDFVVMTGGKIDLFKTQTLLLMQAVKKINNSKIKLIVFGPVVPELKDKINSLADGDFVHYIGKIDAKDSCKYFSACDLAVFPGRHSVFWEEVAGMGIPMVCKYWDGTTHVDVGGNVKFLYNDSVEEIESVIKDIALNPEKYSEMKKIAETKGRDCFMYSEIAKRSLEIK